MSCEQERNHRHIAHKRDGEYQAGRIVHCRLRSPRQRRRAPPSPMSAMPGRTRPVPRRASGPGTRQDRNVQPQHHEQGLCWAFSRKCFQVVGSRQSFPQSLRPQGSSRPQWLLGPWQARRRLPAAGISPACSSGRTTSTAGIAVEDLTKPGVRLKAAGLEGLLVHSTSAVNSHRHHLGVGTGLKGEGGDSDPARKQQHGRAQPRGPPRRPVVDCLPCPISRQTIGTKLTARKNSRPALPGAAEKVSADTITGCVSRDRHAPRLARAGRRGAAGQNCTRPGCRPAQAPA